MMNIVVIEENVTPVAFDGSPSLSKSGIVDIANADNRIAVNMNNSEKCVGGRHDDSPPSLFDRTWKSVLVVSLV